MKVRQPGDPTTYDVRRAFGGSWQSAVEAAYGKPPVWERAPTSARYLVDCVVRMGLWRRDLWLAARKRQPTLVPSVFWVRRHFGNFSNLRHFATKRSAVETARRYLALWDRLGCRPTSDQVRRSGIDLRPLLEALGSKADVADYVGRLRAVRDAKILRAKAG